MFSNMLNEYHNAKQIKLPDVVPASAGGLNKTSRILFPYPFQMLFALIGIWKQNVIADNLYRLGP